MCTCVLSRNNHINTHIHVYTYTHTPSHVQIYIYRHTNKIDHTHTANLPILVQLHVCLGTHYVHAFRRNFVFLVVILEIRLNFCGEKLYAYMYIITDAALICMCFFSDVLTYCVTLQAFICYCSYVKCL